MSKICTRCLLKDFSREQYEKIVVEGIRALPAEDLVSEEIEWGRLEPALRLLASDRPGLRLSIDTFRPGIVSRSFDLIGSFIVNDVSGGSDDWRELVLAVDVA